MIEKNVRKGAILSILLVLYLFSLQAQAQSLASQVIGLIPNDYTSFAVNTLHSEIHESGFSLSTPIKLRPSSRWGAYTRLGHIKFHEQKKLSDTLLSPSELNQVEAGVQYAKFMEKGNAWGVRFSIGSASDYVFQTQDEATFSAIFFLSRPSSTSSQWIYSVFLSNNSPIGNYIPIPGLVYMQRSKKFTGMYGLPFFNLTWLPHQKWTIQASLFLTNFKFDAYYRLKKDFQVYAGALNQQQSYLRANRESPKDRTFYSDTRVYIGIDKFYERGPSLNLQAGLSFDRQISAGQSVFRADDRVTFEKSPYISLTLNFKPPRRQ